MRENEVKPGTRCECADAHPGCGEPWQDRTQRCLSPAVRLVTVRSNATVRLWDGSSVPAHDADHEYEVPLCTACAEWHEAKVSK